LSPDGQFAFLSFHQLPYVVNFSTRSLAEFDRASF